MTRACTHPECHGRRFPGPGGRGRPHSLCLATGSTAPMASITPCARSSSADLVQAYGDGMLRWSNPVPEIFAELMPGEPDCFDVSAAFPADPARNKYGVDAS